MPRGWALRALSAGMQHPVDASAWVKEQIANPPSSGCRMMVAQEVEPGGTASTTLSNGECVYARLPEGAEPGQDLLFVLPPVNEYGEREAIVKTGLAYKQQLVRTQSRKRRWEHRWFELLPGELRYYIVGDQAELYEPCEFVPLAAVVEIERDPTEPASVAIVLERDSGQGKGFQMWQRGVFTMRCDTDDSADEWVARLRDIHEITLQAPAAYGHMQLSDDAANTVDWTAAARAQRGPSAAADADDDAADADVDEPRRRQSLARQQLAESPTKVSFAEKQMEPPEEQKDQQQEEEEEEEEEAPEPPKPVGGLTGGLASGLAGSGKWRKVKLATATARAIRGPSIDERLQRAMEEAQAKASGGGGSSDAPPIAAAPKAAAPAVVSMQLSPEALRAKRRAERMLAGLDPSSDDEAEAKKAKEEAEDEPRLSKEFLAARSRGSLTAAVRVAPPASPHLASPHLTPPHPSPTPTPAHAGAADAALCGGAALPLTDDGVVWRRMAGDAPRVHARLGRVANLLTAGGVGRRQ